MQIDGIAQSIFGAEEFGFWKGFPMRDGNVLEFRRRDDKQLSIAFTQGLLDAAKATKLIMLLNISAFDVYVLQMGYFSECTRRTVEAAFSTFEIGAAKTRF